MKIKLSCKEVSRVLSAQLDTDLPAGERARLRLHLVMCHACRNVQRQFGFLRLAMEQLGDAPPIAERRD